MRYQQQQVQMSLNWREKEAMSTQKLMAATTHLHLKQDEEITRLRRNVSSLTKKNHGLMRQVHELVSRLRQYPSPRIPEETRPTNQDEELQEDPSLKSEEDTQMGDTVEIESTEPAPQATPPPLTKAKSIIEEPARVEHTPLPETAIPADTHPDEEVRITIAGLDCYELHRQNGLREGYNRRARREEEMSLRGWMWFRGIRGRSVLCRGERFDERYDIKAIKRGDKYIIDVRDVEPADRKDIANYNGKYVMGLQGKRGEKRIGERKRIQIVVVEAEEEKKKK
ncbi:hypothetical protein DFP73DRAFT_598618 [Morchella snyderi]|nr:hypothetical protein DFP73DRAFT_598618 [Morchella snyderi]